MGIGQVYFFILMCTAFVLNSCNEGPNHTYFIHIHRYEVDSVGRAFDRLASPKDTDHIDIWLRWSKANVILLLVNGLLVNSDRDFPYSIAIANCSELTTFLLSVLFIFAELEYPQYCVEMCAWFGDGC